MESGGSCTFSTAAESVSLVLITYMFEWFCLGSCKMGKVHTMAYFKPLSRGGLKGGGGGWKVKTAEGENIKMFISDKLHSAKNYLMPEPQATRQQLYLLLCMQSWEITLSYQPRFNSYLQFRIFRETSSLSRKESFKMQTISCICCVCGRQTIFKFKSGSIH